MADTELLLHALAVLLDYCVRSLQLIHALFQSEVRPHPGLQDRGIDRFRDVIRRSKIEAFSLVRGLFHGGQKDHRNIPRIRIGLELFAYLVTTHTRHHDIQQDEIRRRLLNDFQRHLAVDGSLYHVVGGEDALNHVQVFGCVIYCKDHRLRCGDCHFKHPFPKTRKRPSVAG